MWTLDKCSMLKKQRLSKTCSRMSGMLFPECHELIKVRHPTHRYEVTVPCPQKERLLKLFTQNQRYGRFPSNLKLDRDCGHFEKTDYFDPKLSGCNSECNKTLACGHVCRNTCDRCLPGELHAQCYSSCGNTLICGHNCKSEICGSCKLCDMDCEHMCTHMKCKLKCAMPCQRCTEPCHWSCPHHKCSNMCGEVCNRPRCNIRCERKLPCGHTCSGFCGDPCPEPCRLCNVEEFKKLTTVDVENAVFIQLECTHIFESGMLDLELDKQWRRIQRIHCPRCRTAIKTHPRYTDIRNSVFNFRESAKLQLLYMSKRLGIEKVPFSSPHCSEYRNFVEKFGIFLVQTEEIWKLTNRNVL
ncbi:hypothetical protein FSP39_009307 [Pinctada imbricata]|uniref:NFX1-type zinc finger-containing protein 1 n=1 Tax=Pinctada imbricata TaxID=66713 RepID=A0AA89BSJ7_PINIB|nr:hypothetical protein FSP39_009307 [Pinctada imbricata]